MDNSQIGHIARWGGGLWLVVILRYENWHTHIQVKDPMQQKTCLTKMIREITQAIEQNISVKKSYKNEIELVKLLTLI